MVRTSWSLQHTGNFEVADHGRRNFFCLCWLTVVFRCDSGLALMRLSSSLRRVPQCWRKSLRVQRVFSGLVRG